MVRVPGGTFWFGCADGDTDCFLDEKPGSLKTLGSFSIETYEVSVAHYRACVESGPCTAPPDSCSGNNYAAGREQHPVNCVTAPEADVYCGWLDRRLPTEQEWEKAARGSCEKNDLSEDACQGSRVYPWGKDAPTCSTAAMSGCPGDTVPVTAYSGVDSPYGTANQSGNVWEWTSSKSGSNRVRRGGSFYHGARFLRASYRYHVTPSARVAYVGFRCAR